LRQAEMLNVIAKKEAEAGLTEAGATYGHAFRVAQMAMTETVPEESAGPAAARLIEQRRLAQLLRVIAADRAQAGDFAFALIIAKAIKDDPYKRARALLAVAMAQTKAGLKDEAAVALDMALQASRESLSAASITSGAPAEFTAFNYVELLANIAQAQ